MGTVEQINTEGERLTTEMTALAHLGLATLANADRLQRRGYEDLAHAAMGFVQALAETITGLDARLAALAESYKSAKTEADELESLLAEPEVGSEQ